MPMTVADYRDLLRAERTTLQAQLQTLTPEQWATLSPCAGWDILNVVVHLQLGAMFHARMIGNALAGRMESPLNLPEGVDVRTWSKQVHDESHAAGPAANLGLLAERLDGYDAALGQASDADLERPAWFYGLPADLRTLVTAYVNDLVVHASDIRRPLGLEPLFSPAGARFAGQSSLPFLPLFTSVEALNGLTGRVHQTVDGVTTIAELGPGGLHIGPDDGAAPVAGLATDGGTWALLVWRQLPPVEAERLGRLQISGDRALVERYLGAIKTP